MVDPQMNHLKAIGTAAVAQHVRDAQARGAHCTQYDPMTDEVYCVLCHGRWQDYRPHQQERCPSAPIPGAAANSRGSQRRG